MDVKLLYNSVHRKFNQLEIRCDRENQHPAEKSELERRCWNEEHVPGWAAQENVKETLLRPSEWRSICCSSVPSSTLLSHCKTFSNPFKPFQIKLEVYFSKELCSRARGEDVTITDVIIKNPGGNMTWGCE